MFYYYHSDFKKEELRSAAVKVYLCFTADFKCINVKEDIVSIFLNIKLVLIRFLKIML